MTSKLNWIMGNLKKIEGLKGIQTNLGLYLYYIHMKLNPLKLATTITTYIYIWTSPYMP